MTTTIDAVTRTFIRDVSPHDTLRDAAAILAEEHVGALLVTAGNGIQGIFSEVDLTRAIAEGADPDDDRVEDHMTDPVVTIDGDRPMTTAARMMDEQGIRHLLVIDDDKRPKGVVSSRDVVHELSRLA